MKKILVLSDIHGHRESLAAVLAGNAGVDLVAIAGDLTNFGGAADAKAILSLLASAGLAQPPALVAGNCDPPAVRRCFAASGCDLEGRTRELGFATMAGAGGGLFRAGITSFERSEEELYGALAPQLFEARSNAARRPLIVVTHTPPYGTNADRRGEKHVGSGEFAALMVEYAPEVWICGHIHESRCVSLEDGTLVVNPGPCGSGCFAILEIDEKSPDGGAAAVRAELRRL
ncbi:metallophosphoesterase [bacterium]|nr:metallophosphoesterase [bacterium]